MTKAGRSPKRADTVAISFSTTKELKEKIAKAAQEEGRSISNYLTIKLETVFAEEERLAKRREQDAKRKAEKAKLEKEAKAAEQK